IQLKTRVQFSASLGENRVSEPDEEPATQADLVEPRVQRAKRAQPGERPTRACEPAQRATPPRGGECRPLRGLSSFSRSDPGFRTPRCARRPPPGALPVPPA